MRSFFKKIREWILKHFSAQRFVWISIYEKGTFVSGYVYYQSSRQWQQVWQIFLEGVSEKDVTSSKRLAYVLKGAFFPFSYRVVIVSSHKHCASMYSRLSFARAHPRATVNEEEIVGLFSNALLKTLDAQKKIVSQNSDFDDLNALLVNHHVTASSVGSDWYVFDPDRAFGATGSRVSFGMTHTFAFRPLISGVSRLLPRRARLAHVFERGFSLPLWLLLTSVDTSSSRAAKQFIYASVLDSETEIFVYDGSRLSFVDSFTFGARTLYNALNQSLGIDWDGFLALLNRFEEGALSVSTRLFVQSVLDAELQRLTNGIASFKKNSGATTVYIHGGILSTLLAHHPKFNSSNIGSSWGGVYVPSMNNLWDEPHKADLAYVSSMPRVSKMNSLSLKLIRWLIPYDINTTS